MKTGLRTEKQGEVKGIRELGQKSLAENREEKPLVVTADKFVADNLGDRLACLVKGTTPHSEDCGQGGEDCACDCSGGGGNCACDCHDGN